MSMRRVKCMEEVLQRFSDHDSVHAQLSVEEQRILLLSTMLHPLSGCYTTNKKSRQESLPYSIVKDATKFRIKDAVDVQVVLEAAAGLRAMVDTVLELRRDGDRLQSEEQQRYRRLRRDMGLMLLKAKSILETCAVRCTSLVWARRSIRRLATQLTAVVFRVRLRPRLMPKGPPSSGTRKHPYQRADGMADTLNLNDLLINPQ